MYFNINHVISCVYINASKKAYKSHLIATVDFTEKGGDQGWARGAKRPWRGGICNVRSPRSSLHRPLSFCFFLLKKHSHTLLPQLNITLKDLGIILSRTVQLYAS